MARQLSHSTSTGPVLNGAGVPDPPRINFLVEAVSARIKWQDVIRPNCRVQSRVRTISRNLRSGSAHFPQIFCTYSENEK
jgi:hypothetical protein